MWGCNQSFERFRKFSAREKEKDHKSEKSVIPLLPNKNISVILFSTLEIAKCWPNREGGDVNAFGQTFFKPSLMVNIKPGLFCLVAIFCWAMQYVWPLSPERERVIINYTHKWPPPLTWPLFNQNQLLVLQIYFYNNIKVSKHKDTTRPNFAILQLCNSEPPDWGKPH